MKSGQLDMYFVGKEDAIVFIATQGILATTVTEILMEHALLITKIYITPSACIDAALNTRRKIRLSCI